MKTQDISESRILVVLQSWATAGDIVARMGAPASSLRKVLALLRGMCYAGKLESRLRRGPGRGRPPKEYRRK